MASIDNDEELSATRKLNGVEWEEDKQIQVGDYVKTKKHGIFRILSKRKTPYGYYCGATDSNKQPTYTVGKGGSAEIKNDILKHSSNLIDLIEVNDYVNGMLVQKIAEPSLANHYRTLIYCNECEGLYEGIFDNKDIKSIVTHEQFNSIMYEVKE